MTGIGPETQDLYALLGVRRSCSQAEIAKAYKALALRCHPDKNQNNKNSEDLFKFITAAYQVLRDPETRKAYDSKTFNVDNDTRGALSSPRRRCNSCPESIVQVWPDSDEEQTKVPAHVDELLARICGSRNVDSPNVNSICKDSVVSVIGLVNKAEYNGRVGRVIECVGNGSPTSIFKLELGDGVVIKISGRNLVLAQDVQEFPPSKPSPPVMPRRTWRGMFTRMFGGSTSLPKR